MIESLLSLFSILLGIIAANITGFVVEKRKITITNSIAGVFGSILIIKCFGRLGFSPQYIVVPQGINYVSLIINISLSVASGILSSLFIYNLKKKSNKSK